MLCCADIAGSLTFANSEAKGLATSRTAQAVVKALVFDSGGFEMSDHFCLFGKELAYGALGGVNHAMTLVHGDMPIDLEMKLNKDSIARIPCAKIVHAAYASTGDCGRFDALALLGWQFAIQELARCIRCDTPGAGDHAPSNNQSGCRIRALPPRYAGQRQGGENSRI